MANLNLYFSAPQQQLPRITAAQLRARLPTKLAQRSAASVPRASAGTASANGASTNGIDASSAGRRLVLEDPPPVSLCAVCSMAYIKAFNTALLVCCPAARVHIAGTYPGPEECMPWGAAFGSLHGLGMCSGLLAAG